MLTIFRNMTRGWVSLLLIGLLAVAFALFGINDALRPNIGNNLARGTDDVRVTGASFMTRWNRFLESQRNAPEPLTQTQAVAQGLHTALLDSMIDDASVLAIANKVGLTPSNAQIDQRILTEYPVFRNPVTGAYDPAQARELLAQNRISASDLRTSEAEQLARTVVLQSLLAGVRPPSAFGRILRAYETEQRVVTVVEIPASRVPAPGTPQDSDLQALYEEVKGTRFAFPERRDFALAIADTTSYARRIAATIPEADVRARYQQRLDQFTTPERRTLDQVVVSNEASAADAARRLNAGEAAAVVALAVGGTHVRHDNVTRDSFPDRALVDTAFGLAAGATSNPVRGLSWSVMRVVSVQPQVTQTFAEVRDQLAREMAAREVRTQINDALESLREATDEGRPFVDAARAAGLEVLDARQLTRAGQSQDQTAPDPRLADPAVLRAAFDGALNEITDFATLANGSEFAVEIRAIVPAGVRPFAEVRADVEALWRQRQVSAAQRRLAVELAGAVRGGQSLADAATAGRFAVVSRSQPLPRERASQVAMIRAQNPAIVPPLGEQIDEAIFAARAGAVVIGSGTAAPGTPLFVAVVEEVRRTPPAEDQTEIESSRRAVEMLMTAGNPQSGTPGDLIASASASARAQARVRVNPAALSRLIGAGQDPAQ